MDRQNSARSERTSGVGFYDSHLPGRRAPGERQPVYRGRPEVVETIPLPPGKTPSGSDPVFLMRRVRSRNGPPALSRDTLWNPRVRIESYRGDLEARLNQDVPDVHRVCSVCGEIHREAFVVAGWVTGWSRSRVCAYVTETRNRVFRSAKRGRRVEGCESYQRLFPFERRQGEDDVDYVTRC